MIFSGVPLLVPHIESGRLRAIGIGSLKRFPALPEVPTFDESGLKGYEATTWFGLMAPAKVPKDIVARLNVEVGKILASSDVHSTLHQRGRRADRRHAGILHGFHPRRNREIRESRESRQPQRRMSGE